MTVIVAGKGWLAADRCITGDDGETSSLIKVAKNPWLIAAASGNAVSTLDVKRAVRRGASLVEDLIEHVDKDSTALVMTPDGRVFKVEAQRVWSEPSGLSAIGSGGDLALGWLAAMQVDGGPHEDQNEVIRRALRFVARRRSDCGRGIDIRRFGP